MFLGKTLNFQTSILCDGGLAQVSALKWHIPGKNEQPQKKKKRKWKDRLLPVSPKGLRLAQAKQRHRLVSFSPEQANANERYSYRTKTLIYVTECEYNS